MPPKKDKKPKQEPKPVTWRDLPPSVRKNMVEFLQPTVKQQEDLRRSYGIYGRSRDAVKRAETLPDPTIWDDIRPNYLNEEREWRDTTKNWYERDKERYTRAPGIYETYKFFWDDDRPWPDQGPDPDIGGGDMLTT
jgi:hypothetical protein